MTSLTVRPVSPDDLDAAGRVCAQALVFDDFADRLPRALMRQSPLGVVAFAGRELVGVCLTSTGEDPAVGYVDLIAVSPQYQGKSVGGRLLAVAEEQLGRTTIRVTGNPPYYAWPGVDVRYDRAICLFESAGYRRDRCEVNMSVDLETAPLDTEGDERRLAEQGIEVRHARPDDAGWLLADLAAGWKASWLAEVEAALHNDDATVIIAVRDGQCLGFNLYGVSRPNYSGPCGVHPSVRRAGLATVLVRRSMAEQRRLGHARAEFQWIGPYPVIARMLRVAEDPALFVYANRMFVVFTKASGSPHPAPRPAG